MPPRVIRRIGYCPGFASAAICTRKVTRSVGVLFLELELGGGGSVSIFSTLILKTPLSTVALVAPAKPEPRTIAVNVVPRWPENGCMDVALGSAAASATTSKASAGKTTRIDINGVYRNRANALHSRELRRRFELDRTD